MNGGGGRSASARSKREDRSDSEPPSERVLRGTWWPQAAQASPRVASRRSGLRRIGRLYARGAWPGSIGGGEVDVAALDVDGAEPRANPLSYRRARARSVEDPVGRGIEGAHERAAARDSGDHGVERRADA